MECSEDKGVGDRKKPTDLSIPWVRKGVWGVLSLAFLDPLDSGLSQVVLTFVAGSTRRALGNHSRSSCFGVQIKQPAAWFVAGDVIIACP